jgi:uncharacterized repeat protein (TIGR03847 family)
MESPDLIEIERADFVTVGALGRPGQRTFYLQAGQNDLLVTLIIEKEQAAAMGIALGKALEQLGAAEAEGDVTGSDLVEPVEPLFRVGMLKLGYDEARDRVLIIAEELVAEEESRGTRVHIWATRQQASLLSRQAMAVVSAGRQPCPVCHEPMSPNEPHVCVKGNGRKRL